MFSVENLCKDFTRNGSQLTVLDNISFEVKGGEFVALVGPSGCGKSTLLRIIGGLTEQTSGRICFKIEDPNISFMFQNHGLLKWRTLRKNVQLPREIMGHNKAYSAKKLLKKVGLQGFEDYLPCEVSGGMRQRASLARALSFKPNIILMDEPFSGVDELTRESLGLDVKNILSNGKTIFFTTHDLEEAVFLADKIIVMSRRPSRIKEIVEIKLPKDRDLEIKYDKEFQKYVKWIKEILKN